MSESQKSSEIDLQIEQLLELSESKYKISSFNIFKEMKAMYRNKRQSGRAEPNRMGRSATFKKINKVKISMDGLSSRLESQKKSK